MKKFYGLDLGDAESAAALFEEGSREPRIIPIHHVKSLVTAYAEMKDGSLLIGEEACYEPDAVYRCDRFKSRFLEDDESHRDVAAFASGVLSDLIRNGNLDRGDPDAVFYIGCPAGWDANAREEYRQIFEKAGYPPVKIVSESRAALVSACQSKHLQVGVDILHKPVLVVDIGSSTTDLAYINGGREEELKTGGEVRLGGGIMDELLLKQCVEASPSAHKIEKIFRESKAWQSYCDFAARRLKEKYFSDEDYWQENECVQNVSIRYGKMPVRLTLKLNKERAEALLETKSPRLNSRSFAEVFKETLENAKENTKDRTPELIFLTGGVSKMRCIRTWCREVFPDAVVISGSEPEFSVAKGLAWCAEIDDELRLFKQEVDTLISSSTVERIVESRIDDLYKDCVEAMVDPILENGALPVVEKWRQGEIERLADLDTAMQEEIEKYLQTDDARKKMAAPVSLWLKQVSYALEEYTIPICTRHNVPYTALSLNTYLNAADVQVRVDTGDVFAFKEVTFLIDAVISILVGMICGGSGVAVLSSGPLGMVTGTVVSMILLILGKNRMQDAVMKAKIPVPLRKMIPKSFLAARMDVVSGQVKEKLMKKLKEDNSQEFEDRLVRELSEQIEQCLVRMAEVVEIPLGTS